MAAIKAGYPAVNVFEADFPNHSPFIHTCEDSTKDLDYDHMVDHAKITLAFAYELAFADL